MTPRRYRAFLLFGLTTLGLGFTAWSDAGVIFSQDFSSSSTLNDYVGSDSLTQFASITSNEAGGTGTAAIISDALAFHNAADDAQHTPTLSTFVSNSFGTPTLLSAQFVVTASGSPSFTNNNILANIAIGNVVGGGNRDFINFYFKSGTVSVGLNSSANRATISGGGPVAITIFENDSASAETYLGPDGNTHTLNPEKTSLFVGTTLLSDNATPNRDDVAMTGVMFSFNSRILQSAAANLDDGALAFDSIVVQDDLSLVPEPASIALMGLGVSLMLVRRKS